MKGSYAYVDLISPPAGLILIVTKNEESTFWLLKVLVENIVPLYHTKKMENLITDIDVLSELVRLRVPDVHKHIADLGKKATLCLNHNDGQNF